MKDHKAKLTRGRPKLLDRENVLDETVRRYWEYGIANVSVNEISRHSKTSKPALYREFGSEDGLMGAALRHYYATVLSGIEQIFSIDKPLDYVLELWISISLDDSINRNYPAGCLFSAMCDAPRKLGPATKDSVNEVRNRVIGIYEVWFDHARKTGELNNDISTKRAAQYLHAQFCNGMNRQSAGAPVDVTKDILRLALSVLH